MRDNSHEECFEIAFAFTFSPVQLQLYTCVQFPATALASFDLVVCWTFCLCWMMFLVLLVQCALLIHYFVDLCRCICVIGSVSGLIYERSGIVRCVDVVHVDCSFRCIWWWWVHHLRSFPRLIRFDVTLLTWARRLAFSTQRFDRNSVWFQT